MKTLSEHTFSRAVQYHIENHLPIYENVFRAGSKMHFELIKEFKDLYESGVYIPLDEVEEALLKTNIGTWDIYEGTTVPLDYPMFMLEEKDPELNKPKRGGSKKFYVYVRDPDTKNIKKVEWGDTSGLKIKISDPEARRSFAARHNCADKTDRTTPGYWACNMPKYSKQLGLSPASSGNFFW
jgi:hypothetical protein